MESIQFIPCDISSESSVKNAFKEIFESYQHIDAVVNTSYPRNENFGNDFLDVDINDFNENINLHLGGYFLISQVAIKYFLNQGIGNLINIASIYGMLSPNPSIYTDTSRNSSEVYGATKAGLIQMTKYFAVRYSKVPISINCIAPGGILNTSLQGPDFISNYSRLVPMDRLCNAQELANTCLLLANSNVEYLSGQTIALDGGMSSW